MKKTVVVIIFCGFSISVNFCHAENMGNNRPSRQDKSWQIYNKAKSGTVFGKVVDQFGKPVHGAQVTASWYSLGSLIGLGSRRHEDIVNTDKKGRFEYKYGKTQSIRLDAKKDGYDELDSRTEESGFSPKSSIDNPIIMTLRKKEECFFLIEHPRRDIGPKCLLSTEQAQKRTIDIDLLNRDKQNSVPVDKQVADFSVDASFIADSNLWCMSFRSGQSSGGLLCSNQLLYIAPDDGYKDVDTFFCDSSSYDKNVYLYVKSRDPAIYSRVMLKHDSWVEDKTNMVLRVMYKAWINPTGSRILEEDTRVDYDTNKELVKEAKAAILSKKHMPKPDVPKRVKQNKERREAEEAARKKRFKDKK